MATVGNVKIDISRITVRWIMCDNAAIKRCPAQYWKKKKKKDPHVDVPTVWLLRNLSLDGKLCLRDSKNGAFFSPSLAVAGKHVKRHARRAQKRQADFDLLNPYSLGTISTFDSMANLA